MPAPTSVARQRRLIPYPIELNQVSSRSLPKSTFRVGQRTRFPLQTACTKKGPPLGDPVVCERDWLRSVIHAAHTAHSTAARHCRSALLLGSFGDHGLGRDEQPG